MGAQVNQAVVEAQRALDYIGAEISKAYPELVALPPEQREQALWEAYQNDPVRCAPVFAAINKAGTAQAVQHAQALEAQRIQTYGEQEDKKFAQMHPGWDKDPKAADAIQKGALDYMREKGFSEAEMQSSWNGGALRDARVQSMILTL
jgi:hypothetical protein